MVHALLDALIGIAAVLLLFDGMRRLAVGDRSRRTRWTVALSGIFWICGALGYVGYIYTLDKVIALNESAALQTPAPPAVLPRIPLRELEQVTSRDAAITFQTSGVLLKYYDETRDRWSEWHPSQRQLADREEFVSLLAILKLRSVQSFWEACAVWLSGAIAAVSGWYVGRRARAA